MAQYNLLQQKAMEHPRVAGLLTIVLSGLLFYLGFYRPYLQIEAHEEEVHFSLAAIVLSVPLMLAGLVLLLFANRYSAFIFKPNAERTKTQLYTIYGVTIVVTLLVIWLLNHWLVANGYSTI